MNIYVGNLSYTTTEADLRERASQHGEVDTVSVITDRDTGRPRGFAFIEMPVEAEARAAIEALNGLSLDGRTLNVNEARPKGAPSAGGGRRDRW